MFGYVRPLKPELLVREFTRYRSVYCGICRQIGHDYGQLPRLAVNYDLTLLALLLLSLTDWQPSDQPSACVLNPLVKKPMVHGGKVIELCAGLTVLLAWHQAADRVRDDRSWRGRLLQIAFSRAYRRARRRFPIYERIIGRELAELSRLESGPPDPSAATVFGRLLQQIFLEAASLAVSDESVRQAVGLVGRDLGQWIFILDAIDDWAGDCDNGSWNPYGLLDKDAAYRQAVAGMEALELSLDRTAALLPYCRDGGLMANIVTQGLPAMRTRVLSGQKPERL